MTSTRFRSAFAFGTLLLAFAAAAATAQAETRKVLVGMHERVLLDRDLLRISVGNPSVVEMDVLTSRELLALGKSIGRTNLLIWYRDGSTEDIRWTVERDLTVLQQILREIHPGIRVESAPDRDAIILRGEAPNIQYSQLAEAAAENYLSAGSSGILSDGALVLQADSTKSGSAAPEDPVLSATGIAESIAAVPSRSALGGRSGTAVINLIQVGDLPLTLEERIEAAARPVGGPDIDVRRIVRGQLPDDRIDTFVLEGEVDGQVELSRALIAASTVLGATTSRNVQVLANEGGAIATRRGGSSGGGGGGSNRGSGRSGRGGGVRQNLIESNIARAKALSVAGGRILSFIRVRDLPQVRVQVRIFEVNRTRLKDWLPAIDAVKRDTGQSRQFPLFLTAGSTSPGSRPDFGETTLQMATRMAGGIATSQWRVVASDFAIDVFMAFLESEGVARSLARPTLLVLSGESATFNVGGSIPIDRTVTTSAGNQNFADTFFQDFGITLAVRPLVGEDDMITLDVSPDISFPDPVLTAQLQEGTSGGASTSAFETRSLSTSTRLIDGDVLAIGGLLQQSRSEDSSYLPGVHQIPGLGWMAKSLSRNAEETEVVILVSPTIVRDRIPKGDLWAYPDPLEIITAQETRAKKS